MPICKRCNKETKKGNWCAACRVTKARQKRKKELVEYKGGMCEICGYNKCVEAFDFHHKDPNTKEFGIANSGVCRTFEAQRLEVDKCLLLCANCHREIHKELAL